MKVGRQQGCVAKEHRNRGLSLKWVKQGSSSRVDHAAASHAVSADPTTLEATCLFLLVHSLTNQLPPSATLLVALQSCTLTVIQTCQRVDCPCAQAVGHQQWRLQAGRAELL